MHLLLSTKYTDLYNRKRKIKVPDLDAQSLLASLPPPLKSGLLAKHRGFACYLHNEQSCGDRRPSRKKVFGGSLHAQVCSAASCKISRSHPAVRHTWDTASHWRWGATQRGGFSTVMRYYHQVQFDLKVLPPPTSHAHTHTLLTK